jgi:hypothetical protein
MDLQRSAGNQAVLTWLARCNSRPTGTSEDSVPTPTVQRVVQTIQQDRVQASHSDGGDAGQEQASASRGAVSHDLEPVLRPG